MTRRRLRESIRSYFGSYIDPENDEQLKGAKTEIDDKFEGVLKLIRDEDVGGSWRKEAVVELIEDFQRQYQSLYARYDHLTGELRQKFQAKRGSDSSSSSSSSDSESDHSEKGSQHGKMGSKNQGAIARLKEELEKAWRKNRESEDRIQELRVEVSQLKQKLQYQIVESTTKVDNPQEESDSLKTEKNQLLLDLERAKLELVENLNRSESEKAELKSQIAHHQEQEKSYVKLTEDYKQLQGWFNDCTASLEVADRKIEEMANEFNNYAGSKDKAVYELGQIVQNLECDLESKGKELTTLVENVRGLNDKLRQSNQKLRVTEQLLTKNEETFQKAEAKYLEEIKNLEEKVAIFSGTIVDIVKAYGDANMSVSRKANDSTTGIDRLILKLDEDYGKYHNNTIPEMSNEIRMVKSWVVETNIKKQKLENEMSGLVIRLKESEERESDLRDRFEQIQEKVSVLETKVKEKDECIIDLGEEKKAAIRQLCVSIDYHRSRCKLLQETLSKSLIADKTKLRV